MVYIEAPAGVGFSYARDGNVTTDDDLVGLFPLLYGTNQTNLRIALVIVVYLKQLSYLILS